MDRVKKLCMSCAKVNYHKCTTFSCFFFERIFCIVSIILLMIIYWSEQSVCAALERCMQNLVAWIELSLVQLSTSSFSTSFFLTLFRFDGLVWLSYFTHVLLDISAPQTWINVSFAALKPCCQAGHLSTINPNLKAIF